VTSQQLRFGALPAGLGIDQQPVQVEDGGTKSPRKGEGRPFTSGAIS
jgi:hypothetical protein